MSSTTQKVQFGFGAHEPIWHRLRAGNAKLEYLKSPDL